VGTVELRWMGKPPITITCDCGETRRVPYGERWTCEKCKRSWNTAQIPAEDYDGLLRSMRRHKLEALVPATILVAILVPLIAFVSNGFVFVVPIVAAAWLFLFLPFWRRRGRRVAGSAPKWELHPE